MSDLGSPNVSEVDASNSASPPNGFPEGMWPSDLNNSARALMGAVKRFWVRSNSTKTTAGSNAAYTLTYGQPAASYYDGEEHGCIIHVTCVATPTINIDGIGAKKLRKFTAGAWADLDAGDVSTGQPIRFRYNATDDRMDLVIPTIRDYLTTRGDLLTRDANGYVRLAIGAASKLLGSDGTDLVWVGMPEDFKTGDFVITMRNDARTGWVKVDDGTIGKTGSAATTRANDDTLALYTLLYTVCSDAICPVSGGRTGNATNDFNAGKTIALTKTLGRALVVAGSGAGLTARTLGESFGAQTATANTTTAINGTQVYSEGGGGPATGFDHQHSVTVSTVQASTAVNIYLKL